ncbi:hypothetical protein VNO77_02920 [Canavalia gladiata]|uniref:Uncharacterized protein n=1 Tax=Canavalia gladiata TaxID=3824 RepID=A0AAN9R6C7_CANGL
MKHKNLQRGSSNGRDSNKKLTILEALEAFGARSHFFWLGKLRSAKFDTQSMLEEVDNPRSPRTHQTYEELRINKKTDPHSDGASSGVRLRPNRPSQSQYIEPFVVLLRKLAPTGVASMTIKPCDALQKGPKRILRKRQNKRLREVPIQGYLQTKSIEGCGEDAKMKYKEAKVSGKLCTFSEKVVLNCTMECNVQCAVES